jgi:hypothetical protein
MSLTDALDRPAQVTPPPPAEIARVGLKGFFNIAEEWGLSIEDQQTLLGGLPASTLYKWKKAAPGSLTADLLERISYVFGIYKALRIIYTDDALAKAWLERPNRHAWLNGMSPKARMLAGKVSDLYLIRRMVDGMRAPW